MALKPAGLADEMKAGLGFGSLPTSSKNSKVAAAIVKHIMTGVVIFPPGTITGTVPSSGGKIVKGAGSNGKIILVPDTLKILLMAALGESTSQIQGMAGTISASIMSGSVTFDPGNIKGICSNSPSSAGAFTGTGTHGKIVGLSGSKMAKIMAAAIGQAAESPELSDMCDSIAKHITKNAVVSLALVSGVCSAGGGPLIAGAAVGGKII